MPPCHSPVRPVPTGYWPPRVLSICLFPVVLGTDSLSDARAPRLMRNSPCFSRVVRPPPGRLERIAVPCVVHMSYTHRNVTFVGRVRRSKRADVRPTGTRPRPDGPPPPGINFSGKLHARRWAPGPLCPAPGSRRRSRLAGRALGGGRSVPAPLAMPTWKARTHLRVRRRYRCLRRGTGDPGPRSGTVVWSRGPADTSAPLPAGRAAAGQQSPAGQGPACH